MHLLLTDRLACPRCGPEFGLILRADDMEDRRVKAGGLGCPNCREVYPISSGVGDLRPPPRIQEIVGTVTPPDPRRIEVAHALLGVAEGPGQLLTLGAAARYARELAARIPGVEVIEAWIGGYPDGDGPDPMVAPVEGLSRMIVGARLPFFHRGLRGVLMEGSDSRLHLREAARVLAPQHRVVVLDAPEGAGSDLIAAGLTLQLDQEGVVVAGR